MAGGGDAWKAHAALVLVQLNYGAYHVIAKLALSVGMNQIVFCMLRDVVALVILGPIAFINDRRIRPPLTRRLFFSFFFLGLTGIFGNQLLFAIGLQLTSPSHAAALQPAVPVFTFLFALITGAETIKLHRSDGKAKISGVIICVLGAIFMASYKGPALIAGFDGIDLQSAMEGKPAPEPVGWITTSLIQLGVDTWHIGIICLVGNCLCMAIYIVFQAPLLARYPAPLSVTAYSYFFGAGMMVFTGFLLANEPSNWVFTDSEVYAVLYSGTVASALNYGLLTWTNKVLGPSLVSLYMPLQLFASSILAHTFLGSPIYLGSVIGGGFIIAGLYCVTWGRWQAHSNHSSHSNHHSHSHSNNNRRAKANGDSMYRHYPPNKGEHILTDSLYKLLDPKGTVVLPVSKSWQEL